MPDNAKSLVSTEEREALAVAAAELAWSPWPKPEGAFGPASSVTSEAGVGVTTRSHAVDSYVASLDRSAPGERIAADVRRHLLAAAALTKAAKRASDWPDPRLADVAIIETSIADLRETRAIYLATLKLIDADDELIHAIREPLDKAVKELGRVADDLAENAMKKRSSKFAVPNINAGGTSASW
ncbi:MAG: hypothetical protein U5J99_09600 [Parvularculaceae bacterium]|nr:hypothetical protein [Parvularculaceae bacterium]